MMHAATAAASLTVPAGWNSGLCIHCGKDDWEPAADEDDIPGRSMLTCECCLAMVHANPSLAHVMYLQGGVRDRNLQRLCKL